MVQLDFSNSRNFITKSDKPTRENQNWLGPISQSERHVTHVKAEAAMRSPSTVVASPAVLPSNPPAPRGGREIWPAAVITFGLVLTVGWVFLLGYGVIRLMQLAI